MIIRVSFLAAASIAAYAVSHKNRCNSTKNQISSVNFPENDDSNFYQQQIQEGMEDEKKAEIVRSRELKRVNEIEVLHNLAREVQQRKLRLERKLLELCELREEKSFMFHLQRRLDEKLLEIEMLNATIASMQTERKELNEDVKECVLSRKQLETTRKLITEMQKKMEYCKKSNMEVKGRLLIVEEKVSNLPRDEDEGKSVRDAIVEQKLNGVRDAELQVLKMKRRNKELELGKRELTVKLVSAQDTITALSNITESGSIVKIRDEISKLRHTNEDLSRQVERLQNNRFDMVQQLVYQRWLNTCLRLEIQSHNSRKISDRSYESVSPQTSTTSLSDDVFDTTTVELDSSCSSSQRSSTTDKKSGFMHSIKRWGTRRSKDAWSSGGNSFSKKGLVRRFSTSMVPEKASILKNKGENAVKSRGRRVSFSDSVGSTVQSECVLDNSVGSTVQSKCVLDNIKRSCCNSTANSAQNGDIEGETRYEPASSPEVTISCTTSSTTKEDSSITQVSRTEMKVSFSNQENKVDTNVVGLVAASFFLLFILVACFTFYSARSM
ncbi:protein CHUP1, chloroplastic-like [Argentina anserina]|uniref:protein CHUP1, chloroplastic-like n=1 Tax=Argentina anserina TaxID=57926 RepID=UPI002176697D|nr:protein CHUP1, chloroplastic-like [Potentilla anserina]